MRRHYINDKVLIRDIMKIGTIDKIVENKFLVSYYLDNKLKYALIDENHIIEEDEYEKIKNRNNMINRLLDL
jgi:hypothetical protein